MQQVIGFRAEADCNATILEEAEPQAMVADGFAIGRSAASVAGDIQAWLVETEVGAEEAAATATTATTGADTAEADAVAREADAVARKTDAVAREAAAVADALDAATTARDTAALDAAAPEPTAD
jgi:hypothetical protein